MKKVFLLFFGIIISISLFAGRDVVFSIKSGGADIYYSLDIDSIKNDGTSISLYEKDIQISSYNLSEIGNISFGEYIDDDDVTAFSADTIITITFKSASVGFTYKNKEGETVVPVGVTCSYEKKSIGEQDYLLVKIVSSSKNIGYVLTGGTSQRYGGVTMYSDSKCKLTINKLKLLNENAPAINIQTSKRTFVEIGEGDNIIADKGIYPIEGDVSMKAAFFSEGELIFNGAEGDSLTINGDVKHGLASDDYVNIYSGKLIVNTASPVDTIKGDGIKVKDKFLMQGGEVKVKAKGDGIDCTEGYVRIIDGNLNVISGAKGIKSSYDPAEAIAEGKKPDYDIDPYILIDGGTISIKTGVDAVDEKKAHGLKANSNVTINGGDITIYANNVSKSDGVNVGGLFYMNGGVVECYPSRNCYDTSIFVQKGGTFNCNK